MQEVRARRQRKNVDMSENFVCHIHVFLLPKDQSLWGLILNSAGTSRAAFLLAPLPWVLLKDHPELQSRWLELKFLPTSLEEVCEFSLWVLCIFFFTQPNGISLCIHWLVHSKVQRNPFTDFQSPFTLLFESLAQTFSHFSFPKFWPWFAQFNRFPC